MSKEAQELAQLKADNAKLQAALDAARKPDGALPDGLVDERPSFEECCAEGTSVFWLSHTAFLRQAGQPAATRIKASMSAPVKVTLPTHTYREYRGFTLDKKGNKIAAPPSGKFEKVPTKETTFLTKVKLPKPEPSYDHKGQHPMAPKAEKVGRKSKGRAADQD